MPFGLKWPFGRKKAANQAQSSAVASESVSAQLTLQRTSAADALSIANEPRTFELGAEVMNRAAEFGLLPTLGQDAGLNIAQNVGEVGRFIQQLPNSDNLITAPNLPDTNEFVASLASLSSFTNLESTLVLMGALIPPSGLTDELPPLGSLPNQLPGLMGVAPVTPEVGAVSVMPAPTLSPLQALEPMNTAAVHDVGTPLTSATLMPESTAALTSERPFEVTTLLNVERPLVSPNESITPDVPSPVPASFISPSPAADSRRDNFDVAASVERPVAGDFIEPGMPSLALNNFADALPLISPPGEASEITASVIDRIEPTAPVGLPSRPGDGEVVLPLPALSYTSGQPADEPASASASPGSASSTSAAPASESTATSTPLAISRYSEDLPLPAPLALRDEVPPVLNVPSIELPVVAPLPVMNQREDSAPITPETPALVEALSIGKVAQDFLARPLPVEHSSLDLAPVESPTAQPTTGGEPALSISRYAEDMPLIDLDFGWGELEPQPIEPSFDEARATAVETMPSLAATSVPEMALPSIGERADRAAIRSDRAPISISRFSSDLPLNRSTTLNQVTQIQRFSLGSLTQNLPSLGGVTDNLPSLGGLAQNVPSLGGMAENLPPLGGLTDNLSSLGGLAGSIGGQLPQMPSLGGLASSQMPLPPSISDAIGGLGGAGQEALGQITSMAPSMPEMPAMPQMPNIEKLTDQVWREIQRKLKVERERTRGLA